MRRRAAFVLLLTASDLASIAVDGRAQGTRSTPASPDLAAAEALFDDGKRLMESGNYAEACPKLEASVRVDVGIGAILYLAECNVHIGRTASAWGEFREAAALAASRHDTRESLARGRAAELEPRLSRLVVTVSGTHASVVVRRDGDVLDPAVWATPVPVDPGVHTVEALAPGKSPFRAEVAVGPDGATSTVIVPELTDAPAARTSVTPDAPVREAAAVEHPRRALGGQRIAALGAGGLGVVGVALGTYFAVRAKARLDDSNGDGHCHGNQCDAYGVQARNDAGQQADLATAAFAIGGAALATGVVLWLTAPRGRTAIALVPLLAPHEQALGVVGSF